jgi:hypothetical protein
MGPSACPCRRPIDLLATDLAARNDSSDRAWADLTAYRDALAAPRVAPARIRPARPRPAGAQRAEHTSGAAAIHSNLPALTAPVRGLPRSVLRRLFAGP